MPAHDWTKVSDGTFHDLHLAWISNLHASLNCGILPATYYCGIEFQVGRVKGEAMIADEPFVAVETSSTEPIPVTKIVMEGRDNSYRSRRRSLVIRRSSDDGQVARIEMLSQCNKTQPRIFDSCLDKLVGQLETGRHLLVIDLSPPGNCDPDGIHGAIWQAMGFGPYSQPAAEPLTQVAYHVGQYATTAHVQPLAIGETMIDMPLFLTEELHVNVPLEETYQRAFQGMPAKYRAILESSPREV